MPSSKTGPVLLSVKDQTVNICVLMDGMVSVPTFQFCHCSLETDVDNMQTYNHGYITIKLNYKRGSEARHGGTFLVIPALRRQGMEDLEFEGSWATQCDPVSK
jgi:hypothetical protein